MDFVSRTAPASGRTPSSVAPRAGGPPPPGRALYRFLQLLKIKGFSQRFHDEVGPVVLKTHFHQFVEKHALEISRVRIDRGRGDKTQRLLNGDGIIRVNDPTAKIDG